ILSGLLHRGHYTLARIGIRVCQLPRHKRSVYHVRYALAAHRANGEVDVLESEAMRRDLLQRKALRGELRQREFAGLEAVPARALDGDELDRDLADREIREFGHFT